MTDKQLRVTFFGDSICTGQHVAIHQGWVTRTSAQLAHLLKEKEAEVVVTNSSVNGRTTRQALDTIAYELQAHSPEIVIIQFGMNDCNYWKSDKGLPRVSANSFKANLQEIINRTFHFGAKKVFLNTNHPTLLNFSKFDGTDLCYQESNELYNQVIREVGTESPVILNDVENYFQKILEGTENDLGNYLLPGDLLHLSSLGHDAYFSFIYPRIEEVVLKLLET